MDIQVCGAEDICEAQLAALQLLAERLDLFLSIKTELETISSRKAAICRMSGPSLQVAMKNCTRLFAAFQDECRPISSVPPELLPICCFNFFD
jgi:hypothetical protein